jgi:uncharacterized repeat protein (TIGR03803 family)
MRSPGRKCLAVVALIFAILAITPAPAQTFTVLHSFTGIQDGANPFAGLIRDRAGNLYGTTFNGGTGQGSIFRLSHASSGWVLAPLYDFTSVPDGAEPQARVVIGPDGSFYGTTEFGGMNAPTCITSSDWPASNTGCGTVFNLRANLSVCKGAICRWNEAPIYSFEGDQSGFWPGLGDLTFDASGNIYGTAQHGGVSGFGPNGVVYRLSRVNGTWRQTVLYSFTGEDVGSDPEAGVTLDAAGNIYGTVIGGSATTPYGGIYRLSQAGSGWEETTLYQFQGAMDGGNPYGGLITDSDGNFYGVTASGGARGGGTVYQLSLSGGLWQLNVLFPLPGPNIGSYSSLVRDASGAFYGTTFGGGAFGQGSVFKIYFSNGGWRYASLHDFSGGADGRYLYGGVILDPSGNVFGATVTGGVYNEGVLFEIMQ